MMNLESIQKSMGEFGIQNIFVQTGISRSHLYGIKNGDIDPRVSTLQKIVNCLGLEIGFIKAIDLNDRPNLENDDFFRWSMHYYNAPIYTEKKFDQVADVNELLLRALILGRIDAEINTILPTFIYKNRESFDWYYLIGKTSQKAYLGYLLNLIDRFINTPLIASVYSRIYMQLKLSKTSRLIKKRKMGKFEKKRLENVDNEIAETWKFKTLDTLESSKERFYKWM